jgi:hypothetical protein
MAAKGLKCTNEVDSHLYADMGPMLGKSSEP